MIGAVVPVKALAASKSRLVSELDRPTVERLSIAMMRDVVAVLRAVPAVDLVTVVTPDADVALAARREGARALLRSDPGLNAAIEGASAEIVHQPHDGILVMLGDVAAATPSDVATLIGAIRRRGIALAPSKDGGTSALLRIPFDVIPARFGPDSAKRHREEAEHAAAHYRELALPSLAIDIDVAEDLREALASRSLGPHTRLVLESIDLGQT